MSIFIYQSRHSSHDISVVDTASATAPVLPVLTVAVLTLAVVALAVFPLHVTVAVVLPWQTKMIENEETLISTNLFHDDKPQRRA